MAKYSIELRHVVADRGNIFNFPYEFYDEKEREKFERDFIRHFYFREIGAETIDRFLLFLEDKMQTVFPYYNKMFEATKIEYNILDNYYLKESTSLKRENIGTSSGVSSTVGQTFDNQTTETNEERNGSHENDETKTTDTQKNGTNSVEASQTVNGTTSETRNDKKRFLDTPNGQTDLTNSKYLTTLNDDDMTGSGTSKTETDSKTDTTTSETGKDTTTLKSEGSEEQTAKTDITFTGEQRSTADNNTRSRSEGSTNETIVIERKGNIGVDTDSDGIIKHLKLQEILTKIEKMFFDECEDLFMLVY